MPTSPARHATLRERRTVDYIPDQERHGTVSSQFALWLGANLQITAIVTGALAVVLGGDVVWSLVGLALGQGLGGIVMALHAAQGPQLGLPQMISSRVQFGVYGAVIPLVLACLMYVGFSASGVLLAGQALAQLFQIEDAIGIVIFIAVVATLAIFGYRLIHLLGRVSSVIGSMAFIYLFARLLTRADIGQLLAIEHFSFPSFLLSISLSASWQIAYGPYVADYSRYLPRATSSYRTFFAVWFGSVLGSQVSMTFGVLAATIAGKNFAGHEVHFIVGLGASGAMAALLYFTIAFGKLIITALNAYGSVMSVATIVTGFTGQKEISMRVRMSYVFALIVIIAWLALAIRHEFLQQFSAFIIFLLTFFTPWSAINLVDFYCVTKERYDVPALYDPNGRYGRWNMRGIVVYILGILVQLPFLSNHLYTGQFVDKLGGADISWIVGLIVPAALYYLLARRQATNTPKSPVI